MADTATTGNSDAPFGPHNDADATRQAQHTRANDSPTDTNSNAILARSQNLTVDIAGKNFEAGATRRSNLMDIAMGRMSIDAGTGGAG